MFLYYYFSVLYRSNRVCQVLSSPLPIVFTGKRENLTYSVGEASPLNRVYRSVRGPQQNHTYG